ncbi:hypothetical protein ACIQGZ_22615 [Streptomyces sp. NPDC092296]|uniref:hypothetical protein n=1 Tax=Streptomyces sp. NPDC092296 TaxID=3366012 RepID=UPI00380D6E03
MRPAYEAEYPVSATPIYDALYAEYRRLFRALPGDRAGEEDLRFTGFGLRRPYGGRREEMPEQGGRGAGQPDHTHGGHGYAAPHFAQGHQHGSTAPAAQGQPGLGQPGQGGQSGQGHGGWMPVGHIPPASQGHGPAGRHRGMLSLPPGRTGRP